MRQDVDSPSGRGGSRAASLRRKIADEAKEFVATNEAAATKLD